MKALEELDSFPHHSAGASDRGHAVVTGVFDQTTIVSTVVALDRATLQRTKAGARHVLSHPSVAALAFDTRMLTIASRYVGDTPVPFRATLFDKSSSANWLVVWHQDTALPLRTRVDDPAWGPWSTKSGVLYAHAPASALETVVALRLSLDDSTEMNGPLRVLPDTHRRGVLSQEEIDRLAADIAPIDCTVAAGGVVVMRPLTVHASSKAKDDRPRRVLHIEYAANSTLGGGLKLATG